MGLSSVEIRQAIYRQSEARPRQTGAVVDLCIIFIYIRHVFPLKLSIRRHSPGIASFATQPKSKRRILRFVSDYSARAHSDRTSQISISHLINRREKKKDDEFTTRAETDSLRDFIISIPILFFFRAIALCRSPEKKRFSRYFTSFSTKNSIFFDWFRCGGVFRALASETASVSAGVTQADN